MTSVPRQHEAYYVPMLESLEQLLNNDSVLEEV